MLPVCPVVECSRTRARPKSATLTLPPRSRRFCGLTSRCWMPWGPLPPAGCRGSLRKTRALEASRECSKIHGAGGPGKLGGGDAGEALADGLAEAVQERAVGQLHGDDQAVADLPGAEGPQQVRVADV